MIPSRSNRGSYEIVSAFFFVVVLTAIALASVGILQVVEVQTQQRVDEERGYADAQRVKEDLLRCSGPQIIRFDEVTTNCEVGPRVLSVVLTQQPTRGCPYEEKTVVFEDETPAATLVYYIPTESQNTGITCLSKLEVQI